MKKTNLVRRIIAATFCVSILATAFTASASTVIFDYNGLAAGGTVTRVTPESTKNLSGGMFDLTQTGGTYPGNLMPNTPPTENKFAAFCLEPNVGIQVGQAYELDSLESASKYSFASGTGGIGQVKADHIRELMYQVYPVFGAALDNQKALAIQIALWEIVREYEPGAYDLSSGDVSFFSDDNPTGSIALAQSWLDNYVGVVGAVKLDNLASLTLDGGQDLLVQTVPIPPALGMFLLGGVFMRRFMRKRS